MIQAFIFDFGNVLLEWDPRLVYKKYFPDNPTAMENFLQEIDFMNWNAEQDKGRPFADGVAQLSAQFPHYADLIQSYHENWSDSIGNILWGTVDIMKQLKQKGYPIYGLSNWSAETFPIARNKFDFFDLLDDYVVSGEVGTVKPEAEIFNILLNKINTPSQNCLFIDDALPNINQANTMGFNTIHFKSPEHLKNKLTQLGLL